MGLTNRITHSIFSLWARLVTQTMVESEQQSREHQEEQNSRVESKVIWITVVVSVNLSLLYYYGMTNRMGWFINGLRKLFVWLGRSETAEWLVSTITFGTHARFLALIFWAFACVFLYLVVPLLVILVVFREPFSAYGLGLRGALRHFRIYLLFFAIVIPAVVAVSFMEGFREQYPFYKGYTNEIPPYFIAWELAYAVQFLALEFFFRGFMLHGLKQRFGFYAIFVTMIPYCMIHFGKPFPETLGAVLAGFFLGVLSLKTGTIWLGVLIHVSVAWSMDLLALWQKGLL